MSVLGKVAGPMLKDNLVRNGIDLIVDNDLVYFDVSNRRMGVNTTLPGNTLSVNGSTVFSNVYINNTTIASVTSGLTLNPSGGTVSIASSRLINVSEPLLPTDGATRNYVDTSFANIGNLNINDGTSTGSVSLQGGSLRLLGTTNKINVSVSGNAFTITLPSDIVLSGNVSASNFTGPVGTYTTNSGSFTSLSASGETSLGNLAASNVYTTNGIYWTANGLPFGSSTYSNANVASYLPTYSGNIANLTVTGQSTFANAYSNSMYIGTGLFWAGNGSAFSTGSVGYTAITPDSFVGDGTTTTFTLSTTTSTQACIVSVNGIIQIPSTAYSVVGGNALTFTEPPATTDIIDVRSILSSLVSYGNAITDGSNSMVVDPATNTGSITIQGTKKLIANSQAVYMGALSSFNANTSLTQNSLTVVDQFDKTKFRSAKYVVSVSDFANTKYQAAEVIVTHDGTNVFVSPYGVISTNGTPFVTFDAAISGSNVQLKANSSSTVSYASVQQIYVPV